jgi:hypothetical protein
MSLPIAELFSFRMGNMRGIPALSHACLCGDGGWNLDAVLAILDAKACRCTGTVLVGAADGKFRR